MTQDEYITKARKAYNTAMAAPMLSKSDVMLVIDLMLMEREAAQTAVSAETEWKCQFCLWKNAGDRYCRGCARPREEQAPAPPAPETKCDHEWIAVPISPQWVTRQCVRCQAMQRQTWVDMPHPMEAWGK
jgi:hypothetical protein